MACVSSQASPCGMVSLSHPLSFSDHTNISKRMDLSSSYPTNISRRKNSHRWIRQRRKAFSFTLSAALVQAYTLALSEGTSRGISKINDDTLLTASRAMSRAAAASVYTPEMLATKYGSRPFKFRFYVLLIFGINLLRGIMSVTTHNTIGLA